MAKPVPRRGKEQKRPAPKSKRITNYPDIGRPPEDAGTGVTPPPPGGPPGGPPGPPGEPPPNDLGIPGLPPDVAARIHAIFISGRADAEQQALDYLMTTPWFQQEYKGYDQGFAKGVFAAPLSGGLAQYRQYRTQVQGSYQTYYGRPPTQDEIASLITLGWTPEHVQGVGQGHAWAQTNAGDTSYLFGAFDSGALNPDQLQALGEEQTGLDSPLGQSLNLRFQAAVQRMQRVFQGTLGSSVSQDQNLGAKPKAPDISA